ncbi:flagellar assembly protein FliW [Proteiniclasticum sp.]|uniref:flagellar assembly protein FliW n=1 Tax=Proteiniclasticum sp. TaxID=2053595 RepID=UPI0028979480|nr:flagellar assembly protein FliW [Proteiniclasticum sp.]
MIKMIINTKLLGEVEISEEDIINFPDGILGFEESRNFVLLDIPENEFFKILQDIKHEYVSFIVANPWNFKSDYEIDIPDEELYNLDINKKEQIATINIVTLTDIFENSTINLLAPIIINSEKKIGKQYVLNNVSYRTKLPLFLKEDDIVAGFK